MARFVVLIENRPKPLRKGWHLVYGLNKKQKNLSEEQKALIGKAIGSVYIGEERKRENCNNYPSAKGPSCNIISHGMEFTEPIQISRGRGPTCWSIKDAEVRKAIKKKIHGRPILIEGGLLGPPYPIPKTVVPI